MTSAHDEPAGVLPPPAGGEGPRLDTGLACLAVVAAFHEQAVDPHRLHHDWGMEGKPFTEIEILRAARALGFKARAINSRTDRLADTPMPAIAERSDGTFIVLGKIADGKVLAHDPREGRAVALPLEDLEKVWNGRVILIARRANFHERFTKFDITWFIPAIHRYRWVLSEVLLASFFLQLFALATPLFFQVVIDKVLVHQGLTTLDVLVFALVAISLFEVLLGGLRTYLFSHTTNRVDVELGARLFRHLLALPMNYFEARRVGDSVARVRELENIRNFITSSALTVVIDFLFTFVFIAVMFAYSTPLTLIVVGSLPFYIIISLLVTPIFRKRLEEKFRRGAENQAFLVESVTGVETVKAMAVEPQMQRRWEEQLAAYVTASFRTMFLSNITQQAASFINKVVIAATLWFGAKAVMQGDLTVGQLVAFNMLAGRVSQPVLRLASLWQDFQQARVSVERLGDILNTHPESAPSSERANLPDIEGNVQFEHVSFRYRPDASEVLSDITVEIPAGQIVGIVGSSGSGKSTLTKLVQRLHLPEKGRVLVDGVDLALVDTSWLRRQVGVVLQENVLFNRSVRENIALSDPTISMEQVIEAAKLAGAHDFILQLPEGYDTTIGERGTTLSGGQRQRVAIARALVSNPNILIFDEATSALDYESERIIQQNMRRICQGRTVIIIAHRLVAVRIADRILTIEKGRVIEDGTHEQLLKSGGRYAALHNYQTSEPLTEAAE